MGIFRLLLAYLVIACHTSGYKTLFKIDVGTIAVSSFFFISGFLMPLAYQAHYQIFSLWEGLKKFYINRILRIFPIYWASILTVLIMFWINLIRGKALDPSLYKIPTYIQNFLLIGLNQSKVWGGYYRFNNPAWTLDIELQYYLLAPFLILATRRYKMAVNLILIIFSIVSVHFILNPFDLVDIDRSFLAWSVFFILGYAFYESSRLQKLLSRVPIVVSGTILAFLAACLVRSTNIANHLVTLGFMVMSAHLLVLQKKYKFGPIDKLAGDLSYPVYILHIVFFPFFIKFASMVGLDSIGIIPQFIFSLMGHILISTLVGFSALRLIADPIDTLREKIRGHKKGPSILVQEC